MSKKIGFIGLGLMGQAMALRLAEQGFDLTVWNLEPERAAPLVAAGARHAGSPAEVAEQCAIICLCVINGKAVRNVVFGPNGIAQASTKSRLIVDFSTVPPAETRQIAHEASQHALRWVDAPISGGPPAAHTGSLTIMAGAEPADLEAVQPLFQALANRHTHVGAVGTGQEMKVVNQALVGITAVMLAEAITLARSLNLNVDLVPQCLEGGLADSVALQRIWPIMSHESFDPPIGRASQMLKDLHSVDELRKACALELPVLQSAIQQYDTYVNVRGEADKDTFSITHLYQKT